VKIAVSDVAHSLHLFASLMLRRSTFRKFRTVRFNVPSLSIGIIFAFFEIFLHFFFFVSLIFFLLSIFPHFLNIETFIISLMKFFALFSRIRNIANILAFKFRERERERELTFHLYKKIYV